jgi:glycosyltransferase involved in cell wall biosynthesis
MKILVTMGLGPSLVDSQVRPLTKLKKINEIMLIRNSVGPELKKVKYITPKKSYNKLKFLNIFLKFLLTVKFIKRENPSSIISFYLVPHGLIGFISAKITGKPICICLLGTDLNVHCKKKILGNIFLWILKHSNVVTVPGSISKKFLADRGVDRSKIFILPNTIDIDKFRPMSVTKKFDVVTIGRLVEVKHIEIFLQVISELKEELHGIKAGIAGTGPLNIELKRLSKKLKLDNNIEFLGYIEDAPSFLNSGKIYILTSETEGLPTAMIEAMACGLPPVISNVGNVPDVIKDEVNGFLIKDYRNEDDYVTAISKLLSDKKLYKKISENALAVRDVYSVKNAYTIWKKIFTKLQLS